MIRRKKPTPKEMRGMWTVKDWVKLFGPATAESTYIALETIARAREGIVQAAE